MGWGGGSQAAPCTVLRLCLLEGEGGAQEGRAGARGVWPGGVCGKSWVDEGIRGVKAQGTHGHVLKHAPAHTRTRPNCVSTILPPLAPGVAVTAARPALATTPTPLMATAMRRSSRGTRQRGQEPAAARQVGVGVLGSGRWWWMDGWGPVAFRGAWQGLLVLLTGWA